MKENKFSRITIFCKHFVRLFEFITIVIILGINILSCGMGGILSNPFAEEEDIIITYYLNGGNINGNTNPVSINCKRGSYPSGLQENPQKEGYTFVEWYYFDKTQPSNPKTSLGTKPINYDTDAYAEWKEKNPFLGTTWKGKIEEDPYEGILTFNNINNSWTYHKKDDTTYGIWYRGSYTFIGKTATMEYSARSFVGNIEYSKWETYNNLPKFNTTITSDNTIFVFGITFIKQE